MFILEISTIRQLLLSGFVFKVSPSRSQLSFCGAVDMTSFMSNNSDNGVFTSKRFRLELNSYDDDLMQVECEVYDE